MHCIYALKGLIWTLPRVFCLYSQNSVAYYVNKRSLRSVNPPFTRLHHLKTNIYIYIYSLAKNNCSHSIHTYPITVMRYKSIKTFIYRTSTFWSKWHFALNIFRKATDKLTIHSSADYQPEHNAMIVIDRVMPLTNS